MSLNETSKWIRISIPLSATVGEVDKITSDCHKNNMKTKKPFFETVSNEDRLLIDVKATPEEIKKIVKENPVIEF